jgi:hypothetical protein
MKLEKIKLPSNKKFGFFFTFVFIFIASYFFFFKVSIIETYIFFSLAIVFLLITFFNAKALYPLNRLWMRFGLFLGTIINPIILGTIFFLLITPYSLIMRLFGRDELRLKLKKRESHWKIREQLKYQTNFKQQF